jgi:hypothetical protein
MWRLLQSSPRWIFFIEPFLLFIAFILQLLISLSIPIIKVSVRRERYTAQVLTITLSLQPIDLFSLHIKTSAVVANTGEIRLAAQAAPGRPFLTHTLTANPQLRVVGLLFPQVCLSCCSKHKLTITSVYMTLVLGIMASVPLPM